MTPNKTFFLARISAFVLAILGTLIFSAYYYLHDSMLSGAAVGYFFILTAIIVSGYLLMDCLRIIKEEVQILRRKARLHVGILLLNVPLCLFFVGSFFKVINQERITLVNATGQPITDIKSMGCAESQLIGTLAVGGQEEICIPILQDCGISIEYRKNGEMHRETVIGYTTPGAGQKSTYFIGDPNAHDSR